MELLGFNSKNNEIDNVIDVSLYPETNKTKTNSSRYGDINFDTLKEDRNFFFCFRYLNFMKNCCINHISLFSFII